jgi:hypothetical protein
MCNRCTKRNEKAYELESKEKENNPMSAGPVTGPGQDTKERGIIVI